MARVQQVGFEMRDFSEIGADYGACVIQASTLDTGCYMVRNNDEYGRLLMWQGASLSEWYSAVWLKFGSVTGTDGGLVFGWNVGSTSLGKVMIAYTTYKPTAWVSGSVVATATTGLAINTWYLIETHVKIADSGGRIEVKVNGVLVVDYTGDTKPGADTGVDRIYVIADLVATWRFGRDVAWVDHFTLNDTTGAADNTWVGDRRYMGFAPTGNGNYSDGLGSDGNSTDNYLLVDDWATGAQDGATTQVVHDALNESDTYVAANPALPTGATVHAVIVAMEVLKTNAVVATTVKAKLRESATDALGTAQTPLVAYGYLWERFAEKPSGGAWDVTAVNAVEIGVQAAGDFA